MFQGEIFGIGPGGTEAGTDGHEPPAQGLGQHQDVGGNFFRLAGEHGPGAPQTGLHLVQYQQDAVPAAEVVRAGEVPRGRLDDASLALDGLDDKGGVVVRPAPKLLFQGCQVSEGDMVEACGGRTECGLVAGIACGREGTQGFAVKAVMGGQEARPAGGGAALLDGRLHRLGTAVGEGNVTQSRGRDAYQLPGQLSRRFQGGRLDKVGLPGGAEPGDGLPDLERVMAKRQRPVGGHAVQVAVPRAIEEVAPFTPYESFIQLDALQQLAQVGVDIFRK